MTIRQKKKAFGWLMHKGLEFFFGQGKGEVLQFDSHMEEKNRGKFQTV